MSIPSRAELTQRLHMKHCFVVFPDTREQIKNLQKAKEEASKRDPDKEYITITVEDLTHAVQRCGVIHTEEALNALGWNIVIQGQSKDGWALKLHVWMAKEDDGSPLKIMYFDLISEEDGGQLKGGNYALPTLQ